MNRTTVRLVAAALAVGLTIAQLSGIAWLAQTGPSPASPVVMLPSVVITPAPSQTALDRDADQQVEAFVERQRPPT